MKREDVEAISIGHAGSDEAALRESKQDQTVGHDVWARNVAPRDRGGRARPRRSFRRLEAQLAKQEAVIEVQGKVQELLEQLSKSEDNEQL